ncbi:MAG: MmcQ/YjbR family DNA-binding protein [Clostridiales bacterium]|nr:MmcQ/YjbR family DNA-binding protein [Clostridiales bacterium]
MRKEIVEYICSQYGSYPEYPWDKFPDYAVFRHTDNKKWFALVASVGRDKLGIEGDGKVDVINLKIGDPILHDELVHEKGIHPGYHMNKRYWISVLMDGTVSREQVEKLIDVSFIETGSKR